MNDLSSGKGAADENFPVASLLLARRHREVVLAFYAVARLADDIADHPTASPREKLARLGDIEASLRGADAVAPAARLRALMAGRNLSDRHILDLLTAFRQDVDKSRYASWAELMDYCRFSAAPVGRFVLDVHGEDTSTWPASDALCAALQVINHLQDCAKDYRALDRVYLPLDVLTAHGASVEDLAAPSAGPGLRAAIAALARQSQELLRQARPLASEVGDLRLALEIGAIQRLAESLAARLHRRDPLCERVHHRRPEALVLALAGALRAGGGRP
ncbi:MAG TPA: squalene synthase HpnC [Caulobacteraceae bacterium]|nr:squalene synthase HpnC [Caulobacteraceae bacterium]